MLTFPTPSRAASRPGPVAAFYAASKIRAREDFGFKFKEGDDETAWDNTHGLLNFRYTEPMTWWMPMPKDMPRTVEARWPRPSVWPPPQPRGPGTCGQRLLRRGRPRGRQVPRRAMVQRNRLEHELRPRHRRRGGPDFKTKWNPTLSISSTGRSRRHDYRRQEGNCDHRGGARGRSSIRAPLR